MSQSPSNPNPKAETHDDWQDRLIDAALEESVGGASPPDLSQRILAAASLPSPTGELTMATDSAVKSTSFRSWALAASVLVNLGLAVLLLRGGDSQPMVAVNEQPPTPASVDTPPTEPSVAEATTESEVPSELRDESTEESLASEPGQKSGGRPSTDLGSAAVKWQTIDGRPAEVAFSPKDFKNTTQTDSLDAFDPAIVVPEAAPRGGQGESGEAAVVTGPVVYPKSEVWEELSKRRTKYAPADVANKPTPSERPASARRAATTESYEITPGQVDKRINLNAAASDYGVPASEQPQPDSLSVLSERVRELKSRQPKRSGGAEVNEQNAPRFSTLRGFDPSGEQKVEHFYSRLTASRSQKRYDYYVQEPLARTIGEDSGRYREWELGLQPSIPGQPGQQWHGSPDGEGTGPGASGDKYERIYENPFVPAIGGEAVSTFSIDVDTASYANVRQMLHSGHMPPADAVRLEELVNYFDYNYEPPASDSQAPFAAHVETTECPWQPRHRLVRIAVKGREVAKDKRPQSNLVFLVDISGSMNNPDKLPLVVHGMSKLAKQLGENDRVAIVVYASSEGLVLPSTPGTEQDTILAALANLRAGGSTAGGAGITLAYQIAEDNFIEGGVNRVILCTDGDFNVGTTSTGELERLVEKKAKDTGVFLSCIGFGRGNLNDAMMEKITGIGNGNYYYVDGEREAQRVFVKGMTGMLVTIAKDVKIQVEFNPAKVAGYRLLGYENRMLRAQDFNDDKKDAGEIGAGHTVTCLYEIVPMGEPVENNQQPTDIDELKYQSPASFTEAADTNELLTLKMRYKKPDEDTSTKLQWPASDDGSSFGEASGDLQFAAAVANFGMLLRDSQDKGDSSYDAVLEIATSAVGEDGEGRREEFVELVRKAKNLAGETEPTDDSNEAAKEKN